MGALINKLMDDCNRTDQLLGILHLFLTPVVPKLGSRDHHGSLFFFFFFLLQWYKSQSQQGLQKV